MQKSRNLHFASQPAVWGSAFFSIGIGLTVLAGWHWQIPGLTSVIPGAVEMKVNAAFSFVCAGMALILQTRPDRAATRFAGGLLSLVVFLLGLSTLVQYLFKVDFGIDQLVYQDTKQAFNPYRGRMSPLTAWSLMLLGISLSLLPFRRIPWVHFLCAPQIFLIGFVSVLGYMWDANEIITDALLPPVAVHTGFNLMLLGFGVLACRYGVASYSTDFASKITVVELELILGMGIVFLVIVGSFGYTYRASLKFLSAYQWVEHTQEVRLVLKELQAELKEAETSRRLFLLTGDASHHNDLRSKTLETSRGLEKLAKRIEDNPQQLQRLATAQALVTAGLRSLEATSVFEGRTKGMLQAEGFSGDEDVLRFVEISKAMVAMDDVEKDLLARRKAVGEQDRTTMLVSLLTSLGLTALIFMALVLAMRTEMFKRTRSETEIKEFNERLQAAVDDRTAELQTANLRLNRFTYSLAHDLRQPLITSSGFVSLMMRDKAILNDPKNGYYLQRISSAVLNINVITDAILELARISRLQAHRRLVNVTGLAIEIFQRLMESEPHRIVNVSIQPNMQIVCDKELLRLTLRLLIENAWKFTSSVESAGIEIGVTDSGREQILWIKDNGVGFDMAYRDKLFLPFSRLHSGEQFSGLGVGLAYVEAAVFRNLATVGIQSEVGSGTTVSVKFPNQDVTHPAGNASASAGIGIRFQ